MAVRALIPAERLNIAHVNSVDGSTDYESGVVYKAGCVVTYNSNTYVANIDIEDTDTDTPDAAPDKWGLCPNARSLVEGGEVADLENRVAALENTVGDEDSGLVKDVDDLKDNVSGISDNMFANGCVNLLPNYGTSKTDNGITFTVNDDGTVTANGTATADAQIVIFDHINNGRLQNDFKYGLPLKMSGCPSGGSADTYAVGWYRYDNDHNASDFGDGSDTFTVIDPSEFTGNYSNVYIRIKNGTTVNNLVFKPMITLADVPNSDYDHYVPYSMNNTELTERASVSHVADNTTTSQCVWNNHICHVALRFIDLDITTANTWVKVGELPDGVPLPDEVVPLVMCPYPYTSDHPCYVGRIAKNGNVDIYTNSSITNAITRIVGNASYYYA